MNSISLPSTKISPLVDAWVGVGVGTHAAEKIKKNNNRLEWYNRILVLFILRARHSPVPSAQFVVIIARILLLLSDISVRVFWKKHKLNSIRASIFTVKMLIWANGTSTIFGL